VSRDAGVVTPEAVRLDLPEATVGSRGAALLVDWMLQAMLGIALAIAVEAAVDAPLPSWVAVSTALVLSFLVLFGYPIAFETAWQSGGRTPGKALLGLRVVTVEGAPERFRHAAIRAALGLIDFGLTLGMAAVLSSLWSSRNQRLGDMVAGTVVVRERTGAGPSTARRFTVPPAVAGVAQTLDTSALRPRDYGAVRAYLLRVAELPPARREAVGRELLDAISPRLGGLDGQGLPPELLLRAVAARYQERQRPAADAARRAGPSS
jgi:uncharacterized RDD family membrane protein YckC